MLRDNQLRRGGRHKSALLRPQEGRAQLGAAKEAFKPGGGHAIGVKAGFLSADIAGPLVIKVAAAAEAGGARRGWRRRGFRLLAGGGRGGFAGLGGGPAAAQAGMVKAHMLNQRLRQIVNGAENQRGAVVHVGGMGDHHRVEQPLRANRFSRQKGAGRGDGRRVGLRQQHFRRRLAVGIGKAAGGGRREIGQTRDARDARHGEFRLLQQHEALHRFVEPRRVTGGVRRIGELGLDRQMVEAGPQIGERHGDGALAENVAARIGQRQRGGILAIDPHHDLAFAVKAGGIARVNAERRLAIVGGIKIRRQHDVDAGAEKPPGEFR